MISDWCVSIIVEKMNYTPGNFYHVYNQGNDRRVIFIQSPNDYNLFIKLMREKLIPHVDLISYCLMPNHFHFMFKTDDRCGLISKAGCLETNPVSKGIQHLLSGYTRIINKRDGRSGSIFRQRTQARQLDYSVNPRLSDFSRSQDLLNCFLYIHRNPLKAGLVNDLSRWPHSSYAEYAGIRRFSLVNVSMAAELALYDVKYFVSECHAIK